MKRVSTSCAMLALFTMVFSCSSAAPPDALAQGLVDRELSTPRKLLPLVVLADGRVLAAGGHDGSRTLTSSEVFEPETGEWRVTGAMRTARRNHAAVRLADGRVLVAGGTYSASFGALASAEVFDPATGQWTEVRDMSEARNDPAAVLLPDGRVLSAGGRNANSAEIFSPPYLFKGARPVVSAVPDVVSPGTTFTISTPDAGRVTKVTLIALGSVTHAFDQNQRLLTLPVTRGSGVVTVTAPANNNLAPPGYYQLFLVNDAGVPSVGRMVRIAPVP